MSDEPRLRPGQVKVNFRGGMVTYDTPKIEEMSRNNDSKLTFQDRLIKSIFNKNTRHGHAHQKEFRCAFWFTDSNGELLQLPSNEPYILNIDSLKDLFVNIELPKSPWAFALSRPLYGFVAHSQPKTPWPSAWNTWSNSAARAGCWTGPPAGQHRQAQFILQMAHMGPWCTPSKICICML